MFSIVRIAALAAGALCACVAVAQNYPVKPVRVIVSFPPGSGADIVCRTITPRLTEAYGQQFVVDNRAGASGNLGSELAARAVPDGYTLLFTPASVASSQALYTKLGYNLQKDLEPISIIASAPFVLVVHPSLPVKNVKDLIAMAKAKPGQLLYASTGNGGSPHLASELFKMQAKIDIVHIPYKGTPPAVTDLIAGQVSMMFANTLSVLPYVNSGRLRALAISSAKRSAAAPQLPTIAETGMPGFEASAAAPQLPTIAEAGKPGFEASTWFGMLAPTGTPKDIVVRLNRELRKIVQTKTVNDALIAQGADPIGSSAEEFQARIKSDIEKWTRTIKAANVQAE
ncbi:MAG: tripartite tricarboxylate transporter substrate binding protein [Proteobacteria bacterium]|nr:tripartite tricarboxylate transporter substrate binding protein [Pseudomonadota bacterium]